MLERHLEMNGCPRLQPWLRRVDDLELYFLFASVSQRDPQPRYLSRRFRGIGDVSLNNQAVGRARWSEVVDLESRPERLARRSHQNIKLLGRWPDCDDSASRQNQARQDDESEQRRQQQPEACPPTASAALQGGSLWRSQHGR